MANTLYRPGVGIVLLNEDNLIFAGQRLDSTKAWQMPQGGVEKEEPQEAALYREVQEEIGISNFTIIDKTPSIKYKLPSNLVKNFWGGNYIGQEQVWFLAKLKDDSEPINLNYTNDPEFFTYDWVSANFLINNIVHFKLDLYRTIFNHFKLI